MDAQENDDDHSMLLVDIFMGAPVLQRQDGSRVSRMAFQCAVRALATQLPDARYAINLCEHRDAFIAGLCAAAWLGHVTLLPSSRAEDVVAAVASRHPGSYMIGDAGTRLPVDVRVDLDALLGDRMPVTIAPMRVDPDATFVIGFTSGSTGAPVAYPKTLAAFQHTNAANLSGLGQLLPAGSAFNIVATVPPQHMYGMELSVLLPLLAPATVHAGRPFFPQDIAAAVAEMPEPRLLVTTPLHLRALVESAVALPPLAGIVTATAPLPRELAAQAETAFACDVLEMFGATETCVIATRRTASESEWTLLPEVSLKPAEDGTRVQRPSLLEPIILADSLELSDDGKHFTLRGRQADVLEVAGKRASLAELTQRLQAVAGVRDGVMVQPVDADAHGVRRLLAIIVADAAVSDADIHAALRKSCDPVFLPRRIIRVEALPRNETGKLPRAAIDAIITSFSTRASSS